MALKTSADKYTFQQVVDIVFDFAVEHRRATNNKKGKRNIELWVKAKLWDSHVSNASLTKS